MTLDQTVLFAILIAVFTLMIWGRWRYDLVAFAALMAALVAGVVPIDKAFSGFGHPATVIIALVLIVSRGLSKSGVVELVTAKVIDSTRALSLHIAIMSGVAAVLSAVMNNVAALALLMPVDMQAAAKAKRSPALTLMPLSFASILGGMITLIGTPPNIIISAFRETALGAPYAMFDFAPVGLACAVVGVLFVALFGWRLIPIERREQDSAQKLFDLDDYIAELHVPAESALIGEKLQDQAEAIEESGAQVLGLIRNGGRLPGNLHRISLAEDDILVVEGGPESIEKLAGVLSLKAGGKGAGAKLLEGVDLEMREAVVPQGAAIEDRVPNAQRLPHRFGVTLLGISRQGERIRERLGRRRVRAGDILLLLGPSGGLTEAIQRLGCLPLAARGLQVIQRGRAGLAVGIFAVAIALASFGFLYLPVALGCAVTLYVLMGVVPLREIYESVEWSIIILLGSLIPIGEALETSGGTGLIAGGLLWVADGQSGIMVLALLMIVTMTLSDVMNNTATAVIAAPIAVDIATRLQVSADPFLMAVAVAASCAFLTPIGHKNNTLIMGPGGYKFGDYWRMGLPLEILVVVVGVPTILVFWPL